MKIHGISDIFIEVNNPYPTSIDLYKHELDETPFNVYFTEDGVPFSVNIGTSSGGPNYQCKAAITINDIIIDDEYGPEEIYNSTLDIFGVRIRLKDSSGHYPDYDLFPGLMKIQFDLKGSTGVGNYYPVAPLLINIVPSILDNASASPESVGSVAEMLQLYPDLKDFVDSGFKYFKDLETDVTLAMLGTSTYTSTDKIYYITLDEDVLYTGQAAGFKVKLTNIGDTQYIEAQNGKGIYQRTYTSGTGWSEFTNPVADLQSTVGTLNTQLENALNGGGS